MTGVFINYRSADSPTAAESIFRDLAANFGRENVFLDKQAILPGVAYPGKIRAWIQGRCSVMIAVIGPGWLTAEDDSGGRLLFRPHDWVHDEIADALRLGLPVLPVPVHDTPLPAVTDLPGTIGELVDREEIRIRRFDEYEDMQKLIRSIGALDPGLLGDGQEAGHNDMPERAARTSDFMYRGAAQLYSIAYKAEIGAWLIKVSQALGASTTDAVSLLRHIPDRKAADILRVMDRRRALLILHKMAPRERGRLMEHLSPEIRYQLAADDYTGSG